MKRKPVIFKIQKPVMSDTDFRQMLEGVMAHRENLVRFGTPYPPEQPNSELVEQRKHELDAQIAECKAKIKELEDAKERYGQLLRVIYEEESRIKEDQRLRYSGRMESSSEYLQKQ
jgi:DNA-binding transcriptional MerR regulator